MNDAICSTVLRDSQGLVCYLSGLKRGVSVSERGSHLFNYFSYYPGLSRKHFSNSGVIVYEWFHSILEYKSRLYSSPALTSHPHPTFHDSHKPPENTVRN